MARERHDDTALSAHPRPRVWDLLRGKETVSIHHTTFSVPQEPYVEMHSALEFGVLLSGRLRRLGEGYARVLEPGDVWFQGAWEPHAYELLALPTAALSFGMLPQALLGEAGGVGALRLASALCCTPGIAPPPAGRAAS